MSSQATLEVIAKQQPFGLHVLTKQLKEWAKQLIVWTVAGDTDSEGDFAMDLAYRHPLDDLSHRIYAVRLANGSIGMDMSRVFGIGEDEDFRPAGLLLHCISKKSSHL